MMPTRKRWALLFLGYAMANNAFTLDVGPFQKAMLQLADRDVRIAGAWALNDTAEDVLGGVKDRINVVFERPTPFTQNAFFVRKAKAATLEARVEERPTRGSKHYLKVQEEGGQRPKTGFEAQLSRALVYDGIIQSVIPADNARLDRYGNWSAGERNQVMAALKINRDYATNATARSTLRNRKRGKATYFVPKTGLTPDIYSKTADGQIGIVAHLSDKVPVYQRRLGFFDEVGKVFQAEFPKHMSRTLGRMIAKRFG